MRSMGSRRSSKASKRSFSSTRMREHKTPIFIARLANVSSLCWIRLFGAKNFGSLGAVAEIPRPRSAPPGHAEAERNTSLGSRPRTPLTNYASVRSRSERLDCRSLTPVFLFLGSESKLDWTGLEDLQLGAALSALDDLALLDVRRELDGRRALGTARGHDNDRHHLTLLRSGVHWFRTNRRFARSRVSLALVRLAKLDNLAQPLTDTRDRG